MTQIPPSVLLDTYWKIGMPIDKLIGESDYLDLFCRELPFEYQQVQEKDVGLLLKKLRSDGKIKPFHLTNA